MPHYRTRVLTARESELVDRLARYPRYAPLVERLRPTSSPAKPAPAKAPAKADEPEADKPEAEPKSRR